MEPVKNTGDNKLIMLMIDGLRRDMIKGIDGMKMYPLKSEGLTFSYNQAETMLTGFQTSINQVKDSLLGRSIEQDNILY